MALHTTNMTKSYHVQLSSQVRGSTVLSFALVCRVVFEKVTLSLQGLVDRLLGINIALSTVDNRNVAEAKRNDTAGQNIDNVRARIPLK